MRQITSFPFLITDLYKHTDDSVTKLFTNMHDITHSIGETPVL